MATGRPFNKPRIGKIFFFAVQVGENYSPNLVYLVKRGSPTVTLMLEFEVEDWPEEPKKGGYT